MVFKANNDWGTQNIRSGISGISSFFGNLKSNYFTKQQKFGESDTTAINNYVAEVERLKNLQKTTANFNGTIKESIVYKKAFDNTMTGASENAQVFVHGLQNGTENLENMAKASKAAELGMKALSMAGNMLLMWGVSEIVTFIHDLTTASNRLQESAAKLGNEFASTKEDIDDYKTKIEELKNKRLFHVI